MYELTTNVMDVLGFIKKRVPLLASEKMNALGLLRDGEMVAGVLYERWTKNAVWMHVAAIPGRRWMTKEYLRAVFHYPFVQIGVNRLFAFVEVCNVDAVRFMGHIGFTPEAGLIGAASDGGDAIIFCMTKDSCRFLSGEKHDHSVQV